MLPALPVGLREGTGWLCCPCYATLGQVRQVPRTRQGLPALPPMTGFLASPPHRKRENSLQEDRGSFVTTPTAELSSQEETLLGSFLDWSLDYCSGYEGDQESEGEKEGDGESRSHKAAHGLCQTGQWAEGGLSSRALGLTYRKTCPDTGRRERTEPLGHHRLGLGERIWAKCLSS